LATWRLGEKNKGILVHTDPHFLIRNATILGRFLDLFQIDLQADHGDLLLSKLCQAFSGIPYENLTKIIKSDTVISPGSAKRFPTEVIRDYLHYGTGGTCFSLTAAFIAIFNALGIEAHPILADRHYGTDTHCALVLLQETDLLLLDPGFLIHKPIRLPTTIPVTIATGFNTIELGPHEAGRKVDLLTIVNNNRRLRLTYKVSPVDGPTFGRAWERSFAWEMMTYPVLTRCSSGTHHYLQGNILRIRDNTRTTKRTLSSDEQYDVMSKTLGIHKNIITQAFSVISHGTLSSSITD
jgi:arylamine N-acetyltransferase